jgi:chromosome segregation ATPase
MAENYLTTPRTSRVNRSPYSPRPDVERDAYVRAREDANFLNAMDSSARVRVSQLEGTISNLQSRVRAQEEDINSHATTAEEARDTIRQLISENRDLTVRSRAAEQSKADELMRTKKAADEQANELNTSIRSLREDLSASRSAISRLEDENRGLQSSLEADRMSAAEKFALAEEQRNQDAQEIQRMKALYAHAEETGRLRLILADEVDQLQKEKTALAEQLDHMETQHRTVLSSRSELQKENQQGKLLWQNTEEDRVGAETRALALEKKLQEVSSNLVECERRYSSLENFCKQTEGQLADLKEQRNVLKDGKVGLVRDLAETSQIFSDQKREMLKVQREQASILESQELLLDMSKKENVSLTADLFALKSELQDVTNRNADMRQEMDRQEDVLNGTRSKLVGEERQNRSLEEKIVELEGVRENLSKDLDSITSRLGDANQHIDLLGKQVADETAHKNEIVAQMKADFEASNQRHVDEVSDMETRHRNIQADLTSRVDGLSAKNAEHEETILGLDSKVAQLTKRVASVTNSLNQANDLVLNKQHENFQLSEHNQQLEATLEETKELLEGTRQRLVKVTSQCEADRLELEDKLQTLVIARNGLELSLHDCERNLEASELANKNLDNEYQDAKAHWNKDRVDMEAIHVASEDRMHEEILVLQRAKAKLEGEKGVLDRDLARLGEKLADCDDARLRTQADLDGALREVEKFRALSAADRSTSNKLHDSLQDMRIAKEKVDSEYVALDRVKRSCESDGQQLRSQLTDLNRRYNNLTSELQTAKKENHDFQLKNAELDIANKKQTEQLQTSELQLSGKDRMIAELMGHRTNDKRSYQTSSSEMENAFQDVREQLNEMIKRKEDCDQKISALQTQNKSLYDQLRDQMDQFSAKQTEWQRAMQMDKEAYEEEKNFLKNQNALDQDHQSQLIMLQQDNNRLSKTLQEREAQHQQQLMQVRADHKSSMQEAFRRTQSHRMLAEEQEGIISREAAASSARASAERQADRQAQKEETAKKEAIERDVAALREAAMLAEADAIHDSARREARLVSLKAPAPYVSRQREQDLEQNLLVSPIRPSPRREPLFTPTRSSRYTSKYYS